jgi:GT2 family glycosyltransferase/glycosyltransferase involved in cell wall biosynthesis
MSENTATAPGAPMRILFVYRFLTTGGVEVVLRTRLRSLLDRGLPAMACFLESAGGEGLFRGLEDHVRVGGLDRLPEILRSFDPGWVSLIDTPEGIDLVRETCPRARIAFEVHASDLRGLAPLLDPGFPERVDAIVVPSHGQAEIIASLAGGPLRVAIVPNALEAEFRPLPKKTPEPGKVPIIAWVGRWNDYIKNWSGFLEVANRIAGDTAAEFWLVVGSPSPEIERAAIADLETSVGAARFRRFPGLDREQIRDFYAAVARSGGVLLSTSLAESFGLVVLEAMSQGCPAVVPDVGGLRDLVDHGRNGWAYRPGDADAAARCVREALGADPTRRAAISDAARSSALAFTPERSVEALLDVFRGHDVRIADAAPAAGPGTVEPLRRLLSAAAVRLADLERELSSAQAYSGKLVADQRQTEQEARSYVRNLIAERDRTVENLVTERNSTVENLITERDSTVERFRKENAALEGEVRGRDSMIEGYRKENEILARELEAWIGSRLGRLASWYWRLRDTLSRRERSPVPVSEGTGEIAGATLAEPAPATLAETADERPGEREEETSPGSLWEPPDPGRFPAGGSPARPSGEYDLIVLSIIDWDFRFQRPQQIASQFARHGHRVLFLSTTRFLPADGPAWEGVSKLSHVTEIAIRAPRALDVYGGELSDADLDGLEESFVAMSRDWAMGDAVTMVQIPFWGPLADRLRRKLGWRFVYDCMDEWANFPGFGSRTEAQEQRLVREADLTVVSADRLLAKHADAARRCVLAKNGIDLRHYEMRYGPSQIVSDATHPIIGYYGALASWVDVPLIEKIAAAHPSGTVVLAGGHFDVDLSPLERLPNVRLLGQRPYAEMPGLLWSFDICIIPFLVNAITEATNPVKFYEYLYAGKPIVAPALTELKPHADICYLAEGHAEFLDQVRRAIAEPPGDDRRPKRRLVAAANDWSVRFRGIDDGIRDAFPTITVVVVTFDGLDLTRACLESLARETWPRLEIIVVDNGSSDGTVEYLRQAPVVDARIRTILNAENRGFAAANNQGIASASGDVIVLLNNDTVVPPGLFGRLAGHLARDPSIGLICPTTNFAGNEAKIDPGYSKIADMPAWASARAAEHAGKTFPIDVAAMYCVAAPRAVLEAVGPLDENFGIGMFEDDDFSLRVRKAGYSVVCAEDSYVHHVGQGSFRKLSPARYEEIWNRNRSYFEKKWGLAWEPHRARQGTAPAASKIGT